jgi:hypothetical protein
VTPERAEDAPVPLKIACPQCGEEITVEPDVAATTPVDHGAWPTLKGYSANLRDHDELHHPHPA